MVYKFMLSTCLLAASIAQLCEAAPSVVVAPLGPTPSGNRLWIFQVVPDFALAPSGTPLAVELAFAIDHTDLIDVDVNTGVFDTPNPGHNPFTGTVTNGLWVDLIGDRTFGAFGSFTLTTPGPVDLFLIETDGLGLTTLRYGVAASGHPSRGARIAQIVGDTALNFDGHTGTITVPEPTSFIMPAVGAAMFAVAARRRR
ncbi:MAG: hypothetical protein L0228_06335 [Planctomycetes bacterium]|nr:hypothetical protein [Planctomycetota bacterium]